MKFPILGMSLVGLAALTGCRVPLPGSGPMVKGSGTSGTTSHSLKSFDSLTVNGPFVVSVKHGAATGVEVTGDDNLLDKVTVTQRGNEVVCEFEGNVSMKERMTLTVTMPNLADLEVNGAAEVTVDSAMTLNDELDVEANGASQITLTGASRDVSLKVNGASLVTWADFDADKADIELAGASQADIKGTVRDLEADIIGASGLLEGLTAAIADIEASGASQAKLDVSDRGTLKATGASEILYGGSGQVKTDSAVASTVRKK